MDLIVSGFIQVLCMSAGMLFFLKEKKEKKLDYRTPPLIVAPGAEPILDGVLLKI